MAHEPADDVVECDEFEAVCESYRLRVFGLCRKMLRSEADAEDATQEVMLRAFKAWPRFRHGADAWPWLATIASNVCRDLSRRANVVAAYGGSAAAAEWMPRHEPDDAFDQVVQRERDCLVNDALATVAPRYRTSLYLRDIEGWSVAEIAKLGGRSVQAMRSSLSRGRRTLAKRVEELARERNQWPLPAAVSLVRGVRQRLGRVKPAVERAAAATSPLEPAATAAASLGVVHLGAIVQAIAIVAGVVGFSFGDGGDRDRPRGRDTVAAASAAGVSPLGGGAPAVGRTAERPAPVGGTPDRPDNRASGPSVAVSPARVNDDGRTEAPGVRAKPGDPTGDGTTDDWETILYPGGWSCGPKEGRGPVTDLVCDPPGPIDPLTG